MPKVVDIADIEDALTLQQVADILKMHRASVERLIRSRELAAVKIGGRWRITRRDLTDYLNRNHRRAS